jgi:hypothetical protein
MRLKKSARLWFIWLNISPGQTDFISRMIAICALLYWPLALYWTDFGHHGMQLTPLRFGNQIFELPYPPESLVPIISVVHVLCCLAIVCGIKRKICFALPAAILLYYGCLDCAALSHALWMTTTILIALLFSAPRANCSRRIIQVLVTVCYGYTTLNRLSCPDFLNGSSFQHWLVEGEVLKPEFLPFFLNRPVQFWESFSWLVAAAELFFAIGPWFRRTRKPCVILACLFHAGIFVVMARTLMIFSAVMWAGLAAFVDGGRQWWSEEDRVAEDISAEMTGSAFGERYGMSLANLCASAMIFILVAFPGRVFLWPGRALETISYYDRHPYGYSMFLVKDRVIRALLHYQDGKMRWHSESLLQRFAILSSDNNLYSLARHAFKDHVAAERVRIEITYTINERRLETKILDLDRHNCDNPPAVKVMTAPLLSVDLGGLVKSTTKP